MEGDCTDVHVFGLDNIGNTCYLNSTLQCLLSCQKFTNGILNNRCDPKKGIADSLHDVIQNNQRNSAVKLLIKSLMRKVDWFRFLQHNDINEFITLLFDQLNMEIHECRQITVSKMLKCPENTRVATFFSKANRSWHDFVKNENTWFNELCTGQLVRQIICGNCNKIHHNFETFRVIDVDIPEDVGTKCGIASCINAFFQKQCINTGDEDDDKWICDGCKNSAKSIKSCKIVRAPDLLIISLKRFKVDDRGRWIKNKKHVSIPTQINIEQFSVNKEKHFELRAFANHMGCIESGHYNAVCKRSESWYVVDDEYPRKVGSFADQNAYTVFFQRQDA